MWRTRSVRPTSLFLLSYLTVQVASEGYGSDWSKLFVATGPPDYQDVEIVDLSTEENGGHCEFKPDRYPFAATGSLGTYIDDHPMICGGPLTSACYTYDVNTNEWSGSLYSMTKDREFAASVRMNETQWWVLGGLHMADYGDDYIETTEVFTCDSGFSPAVGMPNANQLFNHNVVGIDDRFYMLVGGDPYSDQTWMFDSESNEWTQTDSLSYPRYDAYAGLVVKEDGTRHVVVTGGKRDEDMFLSTTEVFSLDGDMTWQTGPDLPYTMRDGSSVQFRDSFLLVGGVNGGGEIMPEIFYFDPSLWDFVELPQTLSTGRYYATAFMVPDEYVDC